MNFERFNISFLFFDNIRLSNLFRLGQLQKYGFMYCLRKSLYAGQTSKKWYSFSTKLELQTLQILSSLGTLVYRPRSISKLCEDSLNLLNAILNLFS